MSATSEAATGEIAFDEARERRAAGASVILVRRDPETEGYGLCGAVQTVVERLVDLQARLARLRAQ
ncbi:hypothetical protein [Paraburkholderia diazotrophica]|uniref:hypothetical protein n=1 Tax=Paraburkholderia diazotrophica TaxID=667676 RepID=UPI000B87AE55|nr:hypothetical protein [Paraburkholderia diazotrophica]